MRRKRHSSILAASALALAIPIALGCGGGTRGAETAKPPAKAPGTVPDPNMERSQIPEQFRWDLTAIFKSEQYFEGAFPLAEKGRAEIEKCKGKLADPSELASCLALYFLTHQFTNRLTAYAARLLDTHQTSAKYKDASDRSLAAMNALMAQTSFIRKEILALDEEALTKAYAAEPALADYKPYIDEIRRRRDRVLGDEAERLLSLAGDNLWAEIDINELPSDFEKTFGAVMSDLALPTIKDEHDTPVQLSLSSYPKYRASSERRVRKDAVEAFFATLKQFEHVFAGLIEGQARYSTFLARARGYDTVLEAYLDKDNIAPELFLSLIGAVEANLAPLHRYVRLRKKVMGVKELHIYDLYVPMVAGVSKEVPYEEAVRILPEALAPLGEDYIAVLRQALDPRNRWIDVYPHKDKGAGAYSAAVYGIHPYVKMNYLDEPDDLSTLAHELGHALHSYLSMKSQSQMTWSYKPVVAETASTFNQKLLWDHMFARAQTDDEKLYLLNDLVEMIRTTIYRQALFSAFELAFNTAAEKGKPITADFLDETYRGLIEKYYGPDFTVGVNDGIEWAYVHHFFYKYYMYTYAAGLSSGIALAERVQNGGPEAREAYLGMLKAGASKPALDILRDAGVDWTKPEAVEAAARLMDRALGEMEQILERRTK